MSRVLIWDSAAATLQNGIPNEDQALEAPGTGSRSTPVRCFTHEGHIENISYEFLYRAPAGGISPVINWWQEFYNDRPHVGEYAYTAPPDGLAPGQQVAGTAAGANTGCMPPLAQTTDPSRTFPGAQPVDAWAREQTEEVVAGSGVIDHYDVQRQLTLVPNTCRYFPMLIHTLWVRLAVSTTTGLGEDGRLIIAAIIGGQDDDVYFSDVQVLPYTYGS